MDMEHIMSTEPVCQLIDEMMVNQELPFVQEQKKIIPPDMFRHEFQTVRIRLPRRSGHSSAAGYCWFKYNAIVIHPLRRDLDRFLRHDICPHLKVNLPSKKFEDTRCEVFYNSDAFAARLRGLPPSQSPCQMIVFDGASRVDTREKSLDQIIGEFVIPAQLVLPNIKGIVILQ